MKKWWVIIFIFLPIWGSAQIMTLFAGSGSFVGDGGPATAAAINTAEKGAFDKNGNYYVGDFDHERIRKVDTARIITTVAGNGAYIDSGDGGPATNAGLKSPEAVTLDSAGNLFFCESDGSRVRKVDKLTGTITTIAGNGSGTSIGDGGPATAATLEDPLDICFDKFGNLYIAEYGASRVRKVNTLGIISNFAGVNGEYGYSGDGGLADTSKIGGIEGICSDTAGNVYLADIGNSRVFKINTVGIITTVAGTDTGYLFNGDGIPATAANINPTRIAMDDTGNLFIAEYHNFRVRKVDVAGIIHTVAGIGTPGQSGDGGPATDAQFNYPSGLAFDACGNLYITEANHNGLVHKVTFNPSCDPYSHFDSVTLNAYQINPAIPISVYPNPANDLLNIDNVNTQTTYYLQTIVGSVIQQGNLKEGDNTIPLSSLPSGMYILEIGPTPALSQGEGVTQKIIRKIIKQ